MLASECGNQDDPAKYVGSESASQEVYHPNSETTAYCMSPVATALTATQNMQMCMPVFLYILSC